MKRWLMLLPAALLLATLGLDSGKAEEQEPALEGRLLCSRLTDDTWQIWEIELGHGKQKQLTFSPGDKRYPARMLDGRVIYHATQHACYLVQGKTPGVPVLQELWPVGDVVWAPDGTQIAFSKFESGLVDSANLWVSNADGKEIQVITREPGLQSNAAWSPDSKRIAYVHSHGYKSAEIYLLNSDGSGRIRLTNNETRDLLPAWSPDGKLIAYVSDSTGDYEIWVMRADGSDATQLTHSPGLDSRPAWSPDGKKIAFTSNRSGVLEIWVMNSDGTDQQLLERAKGGVCDPAWS